MIKRLNDCTATVTAAALAWIAMTASGVAQVGQPAPAQLGFQGAVTPVMQEIHSFHDRVNVIIIAIAVFVLVLLAWVVFRYNARANPEPSKFSHNTAVEVAWTVVPILILVYIGIFSFKLLFMQYSYPKPDVTIKAIGNAWFWEHEYVDDDFSVTSNMVRDADLLKKELGEDRFDEKYGDLEGVAYTKTLYSDAKPLYQKYGLVRQLSVDNEIAVPVNAVVHMLVTSADVIHSWTIPSFGSKVQAVPGRLTATWFKATKVGVYYGQCSVLCGKEHASMPIAVRVVPKEAYDQWLVAAKSADWDKAKSILLAATNNAATQKIADASVSAQ